MNPQNEATLKTLHELRTDISDIIIYMVAVNAHISWLGGALPKESVETPAFKAILDKLDDMDEKLKRAGCDISGA